MKKINIILIVFFIAFANINAQEYEKIGDNLYRAEYDTTTRSTLIHIDTCNAFRIGGFLNYDIYSPRASFDEDIYMYSAYNESGSNRGYTAGIALEYMSLKNYSAAKLSLGYSHFNSYMASNWYVIDDPMAESISQRQVLDVSTDMISLVPEVAFLGDYYRISLLLGLNFIQSIEGEYYNQSYEDPDVIWLNSTELYNPMDKTFSSKSIVVDAGVSVSLDLEYDYINILPEIKYMFWSNSMIEETSWRYSKLSFGVNVSFGTGKSIRKTIKEKSFVNQYNQRIACPPGYAYNENTNTCEKLECPKGYEMNFEIGKCQKIECPTGYTYNHDNERCEQLPCPTGYQMNFDTGECEKMPCEPGFKMNFDTGKCVEIICDPGYEMNFDSGKCEEIYCQYGYEYSIEVGACVQDMPPYTDYCTGNVLMIASFSSMRQAKKQLEVFEGLGLTGFGISEGFDTQDKTNKRYRLVSGCFNSEIDAFNAMDYFRAVTIPKYGIEPNAEFMKIEVREI